MGLFTNNKKLCPICSNPTPRIFPTTVAGMPICKECNRKIDLPDGVLDGMSVADFRQYIDFWNENKALRDIFKEEIRLVPSYEADNLQIDVTHGLFRLKEDDNALVFEASNLVSFQILEDSEPLFESEGSVLKCYKSDIPEFVKSISDQISRIAVQQQVNEQMERIERERQRERERNGETTTQQSAYYSTTEVELPVPLKYFYVELTLNHPYWGDVSRKMYGPRFKRDDPSVRQYLDDYDLTVGKLHKMATALMKMINPNAGEVYEGGDAQAPKTDAVSEIKRYKELLDAGVITEAEFAAKKRLLLGI